MEWVAKRVIIAVVLICVSCKRPPAQQSGTAAGGPQLQATAVTMRTAAEPGSEPRNQTLIIAGDKARLMSELDTWRLFDMKERTVTFVDEVARTVRTESFDSILRRRRAANAPALPPHYPRLALRPTGQKRPLHGATAEQNVVEHGGYRRELWLADHPEIPRGLFAIMHASERTSTPLQPMMRAVDEALATAAGFPLADRTEIAYGDQKMVVDRSVTAIGKQNVAASALTPPKDFKDLTPKPPAGKKK